MPSRTLTEIWIYPVKSLGGIRVNTVRVLGKGMQHDRRWMLVDEQNRFLTQREHPELALFKLAETTEGFEVTHKNDRLLIPATAKGEDDINAFIWDDQVTVREVGAMQSTWFTRILGYNVRLVQFPERNPRPVDPEYSISNEHVSLADGYPLLVIGEASLADLNGRLAKPLPMNRFRPNLVFRGGEPFEEDHWKNFTIGGHRFAGVKGCARCVLTTVDQETGIKGIEPLATLAKYRRRNGNVYFGQNVLVLEECQIHVGDTINFESGS